MCLDKEQAVAGDADGVHRVEAAGLRGVDAFCWGFSLSVLTEWDSGAETKWRHGHSFLTFQKKMYFCIQNTITQ